LHACHQNNSDVDLDKEKVISDVQNMLSAYHMAIAQEGLTGEFKYLDESDDFYWVPPGYASPLSYDSVRIILTQNAGKFTSIINHWDTLIIIPLTNEIANYSGVLQSSMTDTSQAVIKVKLIESGTLIKRNDQWKLLSGQSANLN